MGLKEYNSKRNFEDTPEPKGKAIKAGKQLTFVVQRHAASRLHYDFRLEMDGVLKSWAVPKGPSLYPKDKRLAMMVEDHPKDYAAFEGTIAEGNYGAGEVEIWDEGVYEALEKKPRKSEDKNLQEQLSAGSIKIIMHGKKLKGEFALVKMHTGADNAWLLIKHKDIEAADEPYDAEKHTAENSKVTQALEAKKKGKNRVAENKSSNAAETSVAEAPLIKKTALYKHLSEKVTAPIVPMLAGSRDAPFDDADWIFEIKWDGYRALADNTGNVPKLYSRNGLSFEKTFPSIYEAISKLEHPMILDGEIVVLDQDGNPSFASVQNYDVHSGDIIVYYVFDLLQLNGLDTIGLKLLQRKELLKDALPISDLIKYSDDIAKNGKDFYEAAKKKNLEGIMAKKADAVYVVGKRSENWLKIKNKQDADAVIIGYTAPKSGSAPFGALLLAEQQPDGSLDYAGHVGSGFSAKLSKELLALMNPLEIAHSPISPMGKTKTPATFIKPLLVARIQYTERTTDGAFRHPVFQGLRKDVLYDMKNSMDEKKKTVLPKKPENFTNKRVVKSELSALENDPKTILELAKKIEQKLKLTNLEKVLFPEKKITKAQIIAYYHAVAPYLLPHLKGRPESLLRFPNGIDKEGFYHKNAGEKVPNFVKTKSQHSESSDRDIEYVLCENEATLLYLANLGCVGLHPWNSKLPKLDKPTWMVIDLDPSDKNTFDEVVEVALATKKLLDKAGAECYCKTSGSTGIHIYVPLGGKYTYDQCRDFAELIALKVHEQLPDSTTMTRALKDRPKNAIYLDYLQNRPGQTLASVYSLRPREAASASTPLLWKEVKKGLDPTKFNIETLPKRLAKFGDIFAPVLGKGIDLLACLEKLG